MKWNIGNGAFLVGVLGALILGVLAGLGIFTAGATLTTVLIIAGVLIGFMNITDKEVMPVMIASLVLGIGGAILLAVPFVGGIFEGIVTMFAYVFIPVGIVLAIKTGLTKGRHK